MIFFGNNAGLFCIFRKIDHTECMIHIAKQLRFHYNELDRMRNVSKH